MIQLETHSDNGTRVLQMYVVGHFVKLSKYPRDGAKCLTLFGKKYQTLRLNDKYFKGVS